MLMRTKINKKILYVVYLLELVVIAFLALQLFRPLQSYHFQANDFERNGNQGIVMDSFPYSDQSGLYVDNSMMEDGTESVDIYSPSLDLPAGSYTIEIQYSGNGASNQYSCDYYYHNKWNAFENENVGLTDGQNMTARTEVSSLTKLNDFQVQISYNGNGYLYITEINILESHALVIKYLVYFVLLFLGLDLIIQFYPFIKDPKDVCVKLLLIFITCLPIFGNDLPLGNDINFHFERIEALATGLREGQLPVRISSYWNNGYGYASSLYYNDLFLLIPALFRLIGTSVQNAYKVYIFVVNVLTTYVTWYAFRKMFSHRASLVGTVLYVLSPYRLMCIYRRAAVGEYTAMAFFPLVILGLFQIYTVAQSKENTRKKCLENELHIILPAIIGYSGIISSHIISTFLVVLLTVIFFFANIKKTFSKRVIGRLAALVLTVFCLNAWFLIPLFDSFRNGIQAVGKAQKADLEARSLSLLQLFNLFPDARKVKMDYSVGVCLIGAAVWIVLAITKGERKDQKLGNICTGMGLLCLFLSTYLFPWNAITAIGTGISGILGNIQFPWRFLGAGTALLTITCMCTVESMPNAVCNGVSKKRVSGILCVLSLLAALFMNYNLGNCDYWGTVTGPNALNSTDLSGAEYLPNQTDPSIFQSVDPVAGDGVVIDHYHKDGGTLEIALENSGAEESYVDIPFLYYPGYIGTDAKTDEKFIGISGESGRTRLLLPSGYSGTIVVRYSERKLWRAAELLSLLTAAVLAVVIGRRKLQPRQLRS